MKNCLYFKIIIVIILLCVIISEKHVYSLNLPEGAICQRGVRDSLDHVCKLIINCSTIENDIKRGKYPAICSFVQNDPVVCCSPDTSNSITTDSPPTTLRPVVKSYSATEMCRQYSELAYEYVRIPPSENSNLTTSRPEYWKKLSCNDDSLTQRIVGGNVVHPKEYPHMALLGYGGHGNGEKFWGCGGSLISNRWILSAAHCVINVGRIASWARLGNLDIKSIAVDEKSRDYQIIKRLVYPDYNRSYVYHDIALFYLETYVEFSDYIRPVCLNTNRSIYFTTATVIGWGRIRSNGPTSSELLQADVRPVAIGQCQKSYPPNLYPRAVLGISDDTMMCAGDFEEGKDTCSGDSGGPMQIPHSKYSCMHTQLGITSFGAYCGSKDTPGIYTRVSHYIGWIESIVWQIS